MLLVRLRCWERVLELSWQEVGSNALHAYICFLETCRVCGRAWTASLVASPAVRQPAQAAECCAFCDLAWLEMSSENPCNSSAASCSSASLVSCSRLVSGLREAPATRSTVLRHQHLRRHASENRSLSQCLCLCDRSARPRESGRVRSTGGPAALARRASISAPPTPAELQAYRECVVVDRAYVQQKFSFR